MKTHHALPVFRSLVFGLLLSLTNTAYAGLSGPPDSHVEAHPDGKHILVFLSYVPEAEDDGKIATLPNGQEVNLREMFPASGCYEIGSTSPLWTAPWNDTDGWDVSDDCRYLIRLNHFGDGDYRLLEGGALSWALKFYDRGKEFKSHDVADLVDYPSLMTFTSSDWHYLWYDVEADDNFTIHDGRIIVRTSTHERYVFDVATGEIVEEHRMWRTITRIGYGLAIVCVGAMAWLVRRRRQKAGSPAVQRPDSHAVAGSQTIRAPAHWYSFGLRTLFAMMTAVGILCWIGFNWPHVAVFFCALASAVALTRMTIRSTRRPSSRRSRLFRLGVHIAAMSLVWCLVYILSTGPVLGLLHRFDAPEDVRTAVFLTVYRPLVWMQYYVPFDNHRLLESYIDAWGIR